MSARRTLIVASLIALVVGVGGGFGVRALAEGVSAVEPLPEVTRAGEIQLKVTYARGPVWLLTPAGDWRPVREGDGVQRPTSFRLGSPEASLRLSGGGVTLDASRGASGRINSGLGPLRLYLERGRINVHASDSTVEAAVPAQELEVAGRSFGMWKRARGALIAGITKEAVLKKSGQQVRIPAGHELFTGGDLVPSPLPPELRLELESAERRGDKTVLGGRTSKLAVAVVTTGGTSTEIEVSSEGRFQALVSGSTPRPRELVVYDAAGREAQIGAPSPTPEVAEGQRIAPRRASREAPEPIFAPTPPPPPQPEPAKVKERAAPPAPVAKDDPPKKEKKREESAKRERSKRPPPSEEVDVIVPPEEAPPVEAPEKKEAPAPKAAPEKGEEEDELKLEWD
jgi:hypothetical protein